MDTIKSVGIMLLLLGMLHAATAAADPVNYDTLKYSTGGMVFLSEDVPGAICALAGGEYIKITSAVQDAFQADDGTDFGRGSEMYYVLSTENSGCTAEVLNPGDVLMKKSGTTSKYAVLDTTPGVEDYTYKTAGAAGNSVAGGVIRINSATPSHPVISAVEGISRLSFPAAGKVARLIDVSKASRAASLDLYYDSDAHSFTSWNGNADKITFGAVVPAHLECYADGADYNEGFVSPRGSKFASMSSSQALFHISKKQPMLVPICS